MRHSKLTIETPKALTVADAVRYTGFCESYIRVLMQRGRLPYIRVGRSIRVLVTDLDEFLSAHRMEALR